MLTGETAADGTQYVNILVRQDAGRRARSTRTAGYNTGRASGSRPPGSIATCSRPKARCASPAIAGTQEQTLASASAATIGASATAPCCSSSTPARRDYPAFQGYTTRLYGLISRESTPIWQKGWTYAYGAELLATNENRDGTAQSR